MTIRVIHGDCIEQMRLLPDSSVDSVVTDPPYELTQARPGGRSEATRGAVMGGFMGLAWDGTGIAYDAAMWAECLRVLKPGGHLLSFGGSRTYHRMACAIEDAGFEIRDQIMWVYGSGFPKSLDVSKAIDKAAGAERPITGPNPSWRKPEANANWRAAEGRADTGNVKSPHLYAPATDAARQWEGWGTALKPSFEPLCFAQKPLTDATEQDIISANLVTLGARLWSLLLVNAAENNLTSNLSELNGACGIAQWTVDEATSTRGALCDQMGTSRFEWATSTSLNIVTSWRDTLAEISKHGSTSTTATKFETTIDWKTLSFCLSQITPCTIIAGLSHPSGSIVFASTAELYFDAELKRWSAIRALSAVAPAISRDRLNSLDVDATVKHEPICVARKPLIGTVAANVLKHGTGALNIDACRIEGDARPWLIHDGGRDAINTYGDGLNGSRAVDDTTVGRWPSNFIHDGSDEVLANFPHTESGVPCGLKTGNNNNVYGQFAGGIPVTGFGDSGSAARFFYCAKASAADRGNGNNHPTVKPTKLMRYLIRLVTPHGGTVLDPFAGSGTTGLAASMESFNAILIEKEESFANIARSRIFNESPLFAEVTA